MTWVSKNCILLIIGMCFARTSFAQNSLLQPVATPNSGALIVVGVDKDGVNEKTNDAVRIAHLLVLETKAFAPENCILHIDASLIGTKSSRRKLKDLKAGGVKIAKSEIGLIKSSYRKQVRASDSNKLFLSIWLGPSTKETLTVGERELDLQEIFSLRRTGKVKKRSYVFGTNTALNFSKTSSYESYGRKSLDEICLNSNSGLPWLCSLTPNTNLIASVNELVDKKQENGLLMLDDLISLEIISSQRHRLLQGQIPIGFSKQGDLSALKRAAIKKLSDSGLSYLRKPAIELLNEYWRSKLDLSKLPLDVSEINCLLSNDLTLEQLRSQLIRLSKPREISVEQHPKAFRFVPDIDWDFAYSRSGSIWIRNRVLGIAKQIQTGLEDVICLGRFTHDEKEFAVAYRKEDSTIVLIDLANFVQTKLTVSFQFKKLFLSGNQIFANTNRGFEACDILFESSRTSIKPRLVARGKRARVVSHMANKGYFVSQANELVEFKKPANADWRLKTLDLVNEQAKHVLYNDASNSFFLVTSNGLRDPSKLSEMLVKVPGNFPPSFALASSEAIVLASSLGQLTVISPDKRKVLASIDTGHTITSLRWAERGRSVETTNTDRKVVTYLANPWFSRYLE